MTDMVKSFSAATAAVQNAGRGAGFKRGMANVAAVNLAAELGKRGINLGAQSENGK